MERRALIEILRKDTTKNRSDIVQTWAVFYYQLKIFFTYRSWVSIETLSILASIAIYYFLSFQVPPNQFVTFGYGESYLAFSIVGVAFANYLQISITRLGHSINHEIHTGTFETILSSPIKLRSYVVAHSMRGFIIAVYYMLGALALGVFVFKIGLHLEWPAISTSVLVLVLMVLSHLGIGVAAAGAILVYKQGDPVTYIFSLVMYFVAGVLFPLQLLSNYPVLETLARLMPYTYALDALRKSLILGLTLADSEVLFDVIILAVFSIITIPAGLAVFRRGYHKVRRDGTVATY